MAKVGRVTSVPAPTGGWNAKDNIADMSPLDAIIMDNFFPTPSDVMLRKGHDTHVTGLVDQVESLMPYQTPTGTDTMFAAAGTSFFDVTTAGAVGAAVVTGLTNARWQSTNYTNSSGTSYLCCFNGVDSPRYWDNSSWLTITGISTPAITNVTPSTLDNPWQHQRRLWAVQTGTLKAWYLPVDAVGGAATALDLSGVARKGGYLVAGGTWTVDAGDGLDDYWVAVTSEGEVIVYRGTDPATATAWTLVGRWEMGLPLGKRCLMKFRGDLLYIATDGVWPLSKALVSARVEPEVALTDRIVSAMNTAAQLYSSHFGWQLMFYQEGTMVILNVPVSEGLNQQQYVMNSISGAWCRFTALEANCWAMLNGVPYFGGDGTVYSFWGTLDDDGSDIQWDCQTAFNYFKNKSQQKRWTMAQPIFQANGIPEISLGLNVDFDTNEPTASLSFSPITYGVWDTSLWDSGIWGGALSVLRNWQSIVGLGFCAATRLIGAAQGIEVRWVSTNFVWEPAENPF